MGAIREGVAVSPFAPVEHFSPAFWAGSGAGGDVGAGFSANAPGDGKASECHNFVEPMDIETLDARQRRRVCFQAAYKPGNALLSAGCPDEDAAAVIQNVPGKIVLSCQTPHRRPEAHPLHRAADAN